MNLNSLGVRNNQIDLSTMSANNFDAINYMGSKMSAASKNIVTGARYTPLGINGKTFDLANRSESAQHEGVIG